MGLKITITNDDDVVLSKFSSRELIELFAGDHCALEPEEVGEELASDVSIEIKRLSELNL